MAFDPVKYQTEYAKKNLRRFEVKVSRIYEPELMEWIESQDNVQEYIKDLVRKDMKRQKRKAEKNQT